MYSLEDRKKARDLYVESGTSYKDIARAIGVSTNNLKKWGARGNWQKERMEHQRSIASFSAKILETMRLTVDKLLENYRGGEQFDAQDVYAHGKAIEALILATAYTGAREMKPFLDLIAALNRNNATAQRVVDVLKGKSKPFARSKYKEA